MNYVSDKPIKNATEDFLDRASFAKHLAQNIISFPNDNALVLGLYGKWGTGKTSVINMSINEINAAINNDKKPLIINFSPWNYTTQSDLIEAFFKSLMAGISNHTIDDNRKYAKLVCQALMSIADYAAILDICLNTPNTFQPIFSIVKRFLISIGSYKSSDLNTKKEQVITDLSALGYKILFIIDDIDRLPDNQIRDIFQLVKQVADFPNITYLLIMDREIVSNALSTVHDSNGESYLEKIVQLSFELPALSPSSIKDFFCAQLSEYIATLSPSVSIDQSYWSYILYDGVLPYLKTLRDAKKVFNTFQFKFSRIAQEVCFEDMVCITTLEVKEPLLYQWILSHQDILCHSSSINRGNPSDIQTQYYYEFNHLGIAPDLAIRILSILFPNFLSSNNVSFNNETRANSRIAHPEKFPLYFRLTIDKKSISRNEINSIIHNFDYNCIIERLSAYTKENQMPFLIDELWALIDTIPVQRIDILLSALLSFRANLEIPKSPSLFLCPSTIYKKLLVRLLEKLPSDTARYETLLKNLQDCDINTLYYLAYIINAICLKVKKTQSSPNSSENLFFSSELFTNLQKEYSDRTNQLLKKTGFFLHPDFNLIFYLWHQFDEHRAKNFLNTLLKTDSNKIRFVCAIAQKWVSGSNSATWSFPFSTYTDIISINRLREFFQSYDKKRLTRLPKVEQEQIASFILCKNNEDNNPISEDEVSNLINSWASEIRGD